MDKTIVKLVEEGHALIEKKDLPGAEKAFRKALELEEDGTVRNNLALVVFHSGDSEQAFAILEPNLGALAGGNPFSFGLAAQILADLGQKKAARKHLDRAISIFEQGRVRKAVGHERWAWHEYTVVIMRGAAALNNHRLVFDLYRRWERYHVSWENRHLAGVAAFNMGRYDRAASLWGSITEIGRFALDMQELAHLVESDLVPPFTLEYRYQDPDEEMGEREEKQQIASYIHHGNTRASALAYLFSSEIEKKSAEGLLSVLIRHGGEWGVEFGKRLLEAAAVSREFKTTAAIALVECGVFAKDEPITMLIDGMEREIRITDREVTLETGPELEELFQRAVKLRDQGSIEDAVKLLEPLYEQGRFHPPSMIALANLYRKMDRLDEARVILEALNELLPENPPILFNLAGLSVQSGATGSALDYLEQLERLELDEEIAARAESLGSLIRRETEPELWGAHLLHELFLASEKEEREAVERKILPLGSSLLRGLKNMPNTWLLNICSIHGLAPGRLRRDREKLIADALNQEKVLRKAVAGLDETERELLGYLLERGGWARLNAVTRKYGTMDHDGYYWVANEPRSHLGQLWSRALVMVGRARLERGYARVVAIPADLQEKLAAIPGVFSR
ncbi:MAG: tetratricopeptide repeat protein [Dethiobacteria bacterium]